MEQVCWLKDGELIRGNLEQALPFLTERGHVISLVGGGGKTTLMYTLADILSRQGQRVAVTTTTHILRPETEALCQSFSDCTARWEKGHYAVWCQDTGKTKLEALLPEDFHKLLTADTVLIEADGAKRLPCKVPADHEPVIPQETDIILGVMGLDACGQPLQDVCFRWERAAALLACGPDHTLTPEDLAFLLLSPQGSQKYVAARQFWAILNKTDNGRLALGIKILEQLRAKGQKQSILTCLAPDQMGGAS